jgi:hypothetical protein
MATSIAPETTRALEGIRQALLDEQDPDPVIRLFSKHRLASGARLRALYAARLKAEADVKRLDAKIDAAQQELQQLRWEHMARWDQPTIDTELPTDADALAYATAKDKAALIHSLLDVWKGQVVGYQLKLNDAGKEWDLSFETWRELLWRLTGENDVRPGWVLVSGYTDASGWRRPDDHERARLEAVRAQLEA